MIYKYKKYVEAGVNGFTLDIRGTQDVTPKHLGDIGEYSYAYLSEAVEQDDRIQAEVVELTVEETEILRESMYAHCRKLFARDRINEISDVQDLIADNMKLIEFNMMLTTRLAGDLWGTNPIPAELKELYKARNKAFLDAVDAGAITLRSDFQDMDKVMERMMGRYTAINKAVRDNYINELKAVGIG